MYNAGRVIVKRGDPGRAFYIIVDGLAKVVKGKIVTALAEAELGPGDFFGELALRTVAAARRPSSPRTVLGE